MKVSNLHLFIRYGTVWYGRCLRRIAGGRNVQVRLRIGTVSLGCSHHTIHCTACGRINLINTCRFQTELFLLLFVSVSFFFFSLAPTVDGEEGYGVYSEPDGIGATPSAASLTRPAVTTAATSRPSNDAEGRQEPVLQTPSAQHVYAAVDSDGADIDLYEGFSDGSGIGDVDVGRIDVYSGFAVAGDAAKASDA